jgi:hypothetical protein
MHPEPALTSSVQTIAVWLSSCLWAGSLSRISSLCRLSFSTADDPLSPRVGYWDGWNCDRYVGAIGLSASVVCGSLLNIVRSCRARDAPFPLLPSIRSPAPKCATESGSSRFRCRSWSSRRPGTTGALRPDLLGPLGPRRLMATLTVTRHRMFVWRGCCYGRRDETFGVVVFDRLAGLLASASMRTPFRADSLPTAGRGHTTPGGPVALGALALWARAAVRAGAFQIFADAVALYSLIRIALSFVRDDPERQPPRLSLRLSGSHSEFLR